MDMRGAVIVTSVVAIALWVASPATGQEQKEPAGQPAAADSASSAEVSKDTQVEVSRDTPAEASSDAPMEAPEDAGRVARAQFSTAIESREPTDSLETLENDVNRVYFFTELVDLTGRTVTHRWEKDGVPMAEVEFQVGGPRWRVHSSKSLEPAWVGTWTVTVVDDSGRVLASETLHYTAAAEPAEPAEPAEAMPPAAPSTVQE
jgi:hypothetical protein